MNILEIKKKILDIVNTKNSILTERIDNLERDYKEYKTRDIKNDVELEKKLFKNLDNDMNLIKNQIDNSTKLYQISMKKINKEIDEKLKFTEETINKKIEEILEKNYDAKISKLEKEIKEIKISLSELEDNLEQITSILQ